MNRKKRRSAASALRNEKKKAQGAKAVGQSQPQFDLTLERMANSGGEPALRAPFADGRRDVARRFYR
jgi:hypothetical protein